MFKMLDFIIKIILLAAFSFGSWLLFGNPVSEYIRDVIRTNRAMRTVRAMRPKRSENPVIQHISLALSVVLKKEVKQEPYLFLIGSGLIFILSFFLLVSLESILTSMAFSFLLASIPYLAVQAYLRGIRIEGSYDGIMLITSLINNYRQNFFNMLEAIDKSALVKSLSYFSRNNLLRLSMKLKSYRSENELDDAIRAFVYSYQTEWSILLGMNIKIAVLDGTDVSASLDDVLLELKNAGETVEANKRFNNESFTMIKFILIPLYLFSVYLCVSIFGFTLQKYLRYQFLTELGLKSAIIMFTSIIICFIIMVIAKKPKYDI